VLDFQLNTLYAVRELLAREKEVFLVCFGSVLPAIEIALKKELAPLFHPIKSKTKPIVTRSHAFSRALRWLHIDWLTGLSMSFVIGWSYNFGFGFTKLS